MGELPGLTRREWLQRHAVGMTVYNIMESGWVPYKCRGCDYPTTSYLLLKSHLNRISSDDELFKQHETVILMGRL